jgi:hypothetical protein
MQRRSQIKVLRGGWPSYAIRPRFSRLSNPAEFDGRIGYHTSSPELWVSFADCLPGDRNLRQKNVTRGGFAFAVLSVLDDLDAVKVGTIRLSCRASQRCRGIAPGFFALYPITSHGDAQAVAGNWFIESI